MKKEPKTVGERIRAIRGKMTQTEFANGLGIKQSMISRYEAGMEIPSSRIMLAIARYGGKSIEWMLTGKQTLSAGMGNQVTKEDLFNSAVKDILDTQEPDAKAFVEMMNDLFKNKERLEKLLGFYRFIKKES